MRDAGIDCSSVSLQAAGAMMHLLQEVLDEEGCALLQHTLRDDNAHARQDAAQGGNADSGIALSENA